MTSRSALHLHRTLGATPLALAVVVALALGGCSSQGKAKGGAEPAPAKPGETTLIGPVWQWIATQTPVEVIAPGDPSRYTLQFHANGQVDARFDCNTGSGPYVTDADRSLGFGNLSSTLAMCPEGSLDTKFKQQLGNTARYFIKGDTLFVDLKTDSGTMRFVPAPAGSR